MVAPKQLNGKENRFDQLESAGVGQSLRNPKNGSVGDLVNKWETVMIRQLCGYKGNTQQFSGSTAREKTKQGEDILASGRISVGKIALAFVDIGDQTRKKRKGMDARVYNRDSLHVGMEKNEDVIGKK